MPIAEYIKSVKPKSVLTPGEGCPLGDILAAEAYLALTGQPVRVVAPYGQGEIPLAVLMAAVCGQPVDRKWVGKGF